MSLNQTPSANRLHIALFGRRNSGKSSLVNAITGQKAALVSDVAGTTTDPVEKAMEVRGIGPCVFIDTAGFDDEGELGALRVASTRKSLEKTDLALLVIASDDLSLEREWADELRRRKIPTIAVVNKTDLHGGETLVSAVSRELKLEPVAVSAKTGEGVGEITSRILRLFPESFACKSITDRLVRPGDTVLHVMPQDEAAPKGRLILPQVQTIRDLLDQSCVVVGITPDRMETALAALKNPPALVITDSQAFAEVEKLTPKESRLTSFSVLFAAYKGDIEAFVEGANAIDRLTPHSRVLIAEACTHAPVGEDIGRVKLPKMLRQRAGEGLVVDIVSGADFPEDLSAYSLIIHCGACMFNRRYVLSRIERAKESGVPITNYGVAIAYLKGILERVVY